MLTQRATSVDPIAASLLVRRPLQDLHDFDNLPMWETVASSRGMLSRVRLCDHSLSQATSHRA